MRFFFACIIFTLSLSAENLVRDFALYKLNEGDKRAPTLLLMGGIHGNEPGAYYASDFFMRHYKITKGSVWVVPVVNPHGMFANSRGVYGDMNRKFASLPASDPDYASIQKIKELLKDPHIDISLHLHDGSGYWRPTYVNDLLNPNRWGNCSVIDQSSLQNAKYGALESFTAQMVADINTHLLMPIHRYHLHNTHTKAKNDLEQLRALTFYSLSLGKPALTNEASKELDLPTRVYYHLLAIESMLGQLGIGFERDFELKVHTIKELLSPALLEINIEGLITLPLNTLRPYITYFPLPKNESLKHIHIQSQSHLLGLLSLNQAQTQVALKYGPTTLSTLLPEYRTFDTSLKSVNVLINGQKHTFPIGSLIYVGENESIEFESLSDYRVNVIGFVLPNQTSESPNESGVKIYKKDLLPKYSLDTTAKTFRAEFYHKDAFSGMITFSFDSPKPQTNAQFFAVSYTPAPTQGKTHIAQAQPQQTTQAKPQESPKTINKPPLPTPSQQPQSQPKPQQTLPQKLFVRSERGVNVRTQGHINAPIITKLPQGTSVNLIEESGKWSKVSYADKEGYIITSALIQTPPTTQPTPNIAQNTASPTQEKTQQTPVKTQKQVDISQTQTTSQTQKPNAKVKVSVALVRNAPHLEAAVVAKAPLGREMHIISLSEDGLWAQIHYIFQGSSGAREINGYVAKRLLTPIER